MDIIALAVPVFVLLILVELALDLLRKTHFYRLNDSISNLSAGMIQQALKLIPEFFLILLYLFIYERSAWFADRLNLQSWWVWLLLFIVIDFQYYWFHRASHRIALFWSGHVVHHQSEEYNLTVALRQSILQSFFVLPFQIPLALVGFPLEMVIIVGALNTIAQFWIHTRWIHHLPNFFEAWLNTPSHHRVHHARNRRYIDKNYAGALIIWDRLFGTFAAEQEDEPVVYGITVPTESWDPLKAQFATLGKLCQQAKHTSGLANRLKIFFKPLGWSPEHGLPPTPFETREPYNPPLARPLPISLAFGLAFILSFIGLNWQQSMPLLTFIGLTLLSLGLLWVLGRSMDGKPALRRSRNGHSMQ